jgi:hypothetical protein
MKSLVYLSIVLLTLFLSVNCSSTKTSNALNESKEPMTLVPSVKEQTSDYIAFSLNATRNKTVEGEYLPSSEDLRIFIFDSKGAIVWNSSHNMNYLMVIGEVLPIKIGASHEYIGHWNKKDNNGKSIQPGSYTAKLIIPAVPNNYSIDLAFKVE